MQAVIGEVFEETEALVARQNWNNQLHMYGLAPIPIACRT